MLLYSEIEPPSFEVDEEAVASFETNSDFMEQSVELLKAVGMATSVLACAQVSGSANAMRPWTRDEGILVGLLVRITKLQMGYLGHVCNRQNELARILLRCLFESATNLKYLTLNADPEIRDRFVKYSLRMEKRLLERIESNIAERGQELPIELRMKASIGRAFRASDVEPRDVDATDRSHWAGSIYHRAKKVGYGEIFDALFGLGSHGLHGNWQDLLSEHLEWTSQGFLPEVRWTSPRPQETLTAALVIADAAHTFCESLPSCDEKQDLLARLDSYSEAAMRLHDLHERFLVRRMHERNEVGESEPGEKSAEFE